MRVQQTMAVTCAIALTLAAGCKSEAKNDTAVTVDSSVVAPAPAPAAPAPVTTELASKPGSKVTAQAIATHGTDSVTVVLNAANLEAGKTYEAHIHTGDCAKGGPVAVPLGAIVAGADGNGTSTTTVALSKLSVDKPAYVQIHGLNKKPAACGDMPAHGAPSGSMSTTGAAPATAPSP